MNNVHWKFSLSDPGSGSLGNSRKGGPDQKLSKELSKRMMKLSRKLSKVEMKLSREISKLRMKLSKKSRKLSRKLSKVASSIKVDLKAT